MAVHQSNRINPKLLSMMALSACLSGCMSLSPSTPVIEELRLKPASIVVNRATETEVLIRFTPPTGIVVTDMKYRLDEGAWSPQTNTSGWKLKTLSLNVGDHVVELNAIADGKNRLVGEIDLKVIETEAGGLDFGGASPQNSDTPKAHIVIVV